MRQLIVDYIPFDIKPSQINESMKENDGKLIVSGILQRANAENQNGRIYPKEILVREANKYNKTFISERRAMGELDHPESSVVNLANVSHNIREMKWENDDLVGTVEVLPTPAGNILKELFKSGIKLGISSRGMGSVEAIDEDDAGKQTVAVQPDFELIAFDFVSNPSTQGAFLRPTNEGVINESVEYRMDERNPNECGEWCKVESIANDIIRGM
jgi:hypothetical protein|tara:strand:+ start:762 stop:1406 length:645 start_codon:yes stop_codon:yes gene_type:complete